MIHPATSIDLTAASATFHASLIGGDYWDTLASTMRPELKQVGDEHIDYTFDACIDHGLAAEGVDPRSPDGVAALRQWTDLRAKTCAAILAKLPVIDGHVRGHRLIACEPVKLRPALGLFWTHNLEDWPDPYAPWSDNARDAPTLVIEAMIPVNAIDWQFSCMALMDWYSGDAESELRVYPGHSVKLIGCTALSDDKTVTIPEVAYTT
jgi:hypothetical protein